MTGMSELHLQIIRERLKRRDKVEVDTKRAEDSLSRNDPGQRRGHVSPQEADRRPRPVRRSPHPHVPAARRTSNVEEFATKERFPSMKRVLTTIRGQQLPVGRFDRRRHDSQQLPAGRRKGFQGAARARRDRRLQGAERVRRSASSASTTRSTARKQAFKTAGSMAFRNVFQQAKPALLEPIVEMHVTVPGGKLGDINSDMSGRRGRVLGMDSAGGDLQTVIAEVPLGRSDHLRPQPIEHHRRPRQLHDGVQPLRRRARQRPERDHRQGRAEGRGRGVSASEMPAAFALNLR